MLIACNSIYFVVLLSCVLSSERWRLTWINTEIYLCSCHTFPAFCRS